MLPGVSWNAHSVPNIDMRWFIFALVGLLVAVAAIIYKETHVVEPEPAQIAEKSSLRSQIGPDAPEVVHVVIELQEGTQSRYVYNEEEELLQLEETPFHELNMPGDYGYIPQTLTRGGGLLGAVVLTTDPVPPSTLVKARPIAVIIADEGNQMRTSILAVPIADIRYRDVKEIADLQAEDKEAVIDYINNYRSLQGRPAASVTYDGAEVARRVIELAMRAFKSNEK